MEAKQFKVLVADSDMPTRFMLETYLTSKGCIVTSGMSPFDFSEQIINNTFDAIVTDINMPNLNGSEFLLWLKNNKIQSKIILMTVFSSDLSKSGTLEYIEKPVNFEKLYQIIIKSEEKEFKGKVHEINIFDFVQILLLSRKNKLALIKSDVTGVEGKLYIQDGEVIHAEYNDLSGLPAFYKIMSVQKGSFLDTEWSEPSEKTINFPAQALLMEASRVIDEETSKLSEERDLSKLAETEQLKVLLVDDDKNNLVVIKRYLALKNYYVITEDSPISATVLLSEFKFDFIISDINMPEMSGLELLLLVKESGIDSKVILMTGHGSSELKEEALALGSIKYLEKPIKPEELYNALDSGLKGSINKITLMDLMQITINSRQNKIINVIDDNTKKEGKVYIKEGKFVHSEFLELKGEDAFFKITSIDKGTFSANNWSEPEEVTITNSTMSLLLKVGKIDGDLTSHSLNIQFNSEIIENIENSSATHLNQKVSFKIST